jgi:uncharacterized protein YeaO (DUF488 family)
MAIRIVRLGTPRKTGEGTRIGTVRHPPRGVPKTEYAGRDLYDVWLPELAPSAELIAWARAGPWSDARWKTFRRRYRAEMGRPQARHLIELLASLSTTGNLSVGCYCEDETRCHRSVLRELLTEAGAVPA